MVDDITTAANESEMVFPWGQNPQWTSICVMKQKVAYVRSQRHSKRVRSGTRCHRIGKTTHCRPTYRTKHWTTYHREYSDKCIKYKFTRTCSAGHAFYEKQFPPGVCAREPTDENDDSVQLQDIWQFELHVPWRLQKWHARRISFYRAMPVRLLMLRQPYSCHIHPCCSGQTKPWDAIKTSARPVASWSCLLVLRMSLWNAHAQHQQKLQYKKTRS